MKNLFELMAIFLRIGLFTFGGGYAMLPLLQSELVDKKKWLTQEQLMDYFCIGQSTPGIIAVNVATFVGYNRAKVIGAVLATLALISFPVLIILSLAKVLFIYNDNQYVIRAFIGIRIVVTALIIEAVVKLWRTANKGYFEYCLFALSLLLVIWLKCSPVMLVAAGMFLGIFLYMRRRGK